MTTPGFSQKQLANLRRIKEDRVCLGETLLVNKERKPIKYWDHQIEELRSKAMKKIHEDGRGVGKSINLQCIIWDDILTSSDEVLVATPGEAALQPIIDNFKFQMEMNPVIANAIKHAKNIPYYTVFTKAGGIIHFRPAGPNGLAFRGLHVKRMRIDEAAYMPNAAMSALNGCFEIGEKRNLCVWSTPNGDRSRKYYNMCLDPAFEKYHWPSTINPYWTQEQWDEKVIFYGGDNTPEFQHEVLGEHGSPTFGVFNMDLYADCLEEIPEYLYQSVSGQDLQHKDQIPDMLKFEPDGGKYIIGCDLGYASDPAEIVIHRLVGDTMRRVYRLHCENVKYPILTRILLYLIKHSDAVMTGIDEGGNGMYVGQELGIEAPLWWDRIVMIPFGGSSIIGYDQEAQQDIRTPNKKFMTQLITAAINRGEWQIPGKWNGREKISIDTIMENQYTQHQYAFSSSGAVVYSKGNDHIIDADRCGFYALWKTKQPGNGGVFFP